MMTRTLPLNLIHEPLVGREIWTQDFCTREASRIEVGAQRVQTYISVSREPGADGEAICQRLAQRLKLRYVGRPLLDQLALVLHTTPERLEQLEEGPPTCLDEVLLGLLQPQEPSMEAYAIRLGRAVYAAACLRSTVFLGGMAQFFLPRLQGVCVRLIAEPRERIDFIKRTKGYTEARALHWIADTDRRKREFSLRFFRKDIQAPEHYDLILDATRLGIERCVDLIAHAYEGLYRAPGGVLY
ncbi:MAG: hypothetical protein AMXMBFR7_41990 [Planctomycetota bacterium]